MTNGQQERLDLGKAVVIFGDVEVHLLQAKKGREFVGYPGIELGRQPQNQFARELN